VIFGYHARPELSECLWAPAIHSEHNLPEGKFQRQARDGNLRRLRRLAPEANPPPVTPFPFFSYSLEKSCRS
jgi:hypothetical protein